MRIDKFLKLSRISKRRTVAKKLCDNGNVFYGEEDKKIKPSHDVEAGDIITIYIYDKKIVFKIKKIPKNKNVSKQKARKLYDIITEDKVES